MLGGRDPVIIFQIKKLAGTPVGNFLSTFPLLSEIPFATEMPPVPIYLSTRLTGLAIVSEDKSVDINTDVESAADGSAADETQKAIASTVTISIEAEKSNVGVVLLSAMIDLIFDKVTSKEYSISYLNGSTTIFRGLVQSYQVNQNADNTLLDIQIVLTKGKKEPKEKAGVSEVEAKSGTEVLEE